MQQQIVPTSPKYKGPDKKIKKANSAFSVRLHWLEYVVLLVFCFLGGAGSFIFLQNYGSTMPNLESQIIYMRDQVNKVTTKEEAIDKISPSILIVYEKNEKGDYEDAVPIGRGIALTSDGWVATVLPLNTYEADKLVMITEDKKIRAPLNLVYDEYSQVYFFRTEGEGDLKPAQFADAETIMLADNVMAVTNSLTNSLKVSRTNIENISFADKTNFNISAKPYNYSLAAELKDDYFGAPVINDSGDVVGILIKNNQVLPHKYFTAVMTQAISNKKIERISLDFEYTDLSRQIDPDYDKGAEIIKIEKNNNLFVDDIIQKIDGQEIDKYHNLTELLQEYKPGDSAVFTIIRKEKEQEITVQF